MENYILQQIDGVTFRMREAFDFEFLRKFGRVFQAFDDQDSGNICFGMERDGERLFVKFAGAPTARYEGAASEAVQRLKQTVPIYEAIRHDTLIEYLGSEEIGGGFALIFRWTDAHCMGRMYPEERAKFLRLSLEKRLTVFRDILRFLEAVHEAGYVAVDFYDGSVMYNFEAEKTVVCDIDFFRKKPCTNDMGRMWGSSLFMAPEEHVLGAKIDEVTNVYTAGAMAFALLADFDRSGEKWTLSDGLYRVAAKAVSEERSQRWNSLREFREVWERELMTGGK